MFLIARVNQKECFIHFFFKYNFKTFKRIKLCVFYLYKAGRWC